MSGIIDVRPLGAPSRLRLYSAVNLVSFACTYYRIEVPFRTARDLGEADYLIEEMASAEADEFMDTSDIHLMWMLIGDKIKAVLESRKNEKPVFDRTLKRWRNPTKFVFDSDDDAEYVDPFNPRFQSLGTIGTDDKTKLKPGDNISIKIDENVHPVWRDGYEGPFGGTFDIQDNLNRIELFSKIPRLSAGVTVSTEPLARVYRERYGCENVYVFPNSIRFDDYPKINLKRSRKTVTILWQGGWSHYRDIEPLAEPLGRISRKYPHVRFIFWGYHFKWMANQIPVTRCEFIGWTPYEAYKLRLATIDFDINLAPLADRVFNHSKSAIKFYESASLDLPRPTLAANIGPYKEIIDGETGMLYDTMDEFEEKLCTLIENATLRKTLGENAKDWIKEHRDAFITVPPLLEWYRSLAHG